MQLMSGDQSGPVVELEGPLLSDGHVPFKVKTRALQRAHSMNTSTQSRPNDSNMILTRLQMNTNRCLWNQIMALQDSCIDPLV